MEKTQKQITVREFEDALWDFVLEHSDVTDGGSYFVKFHCSSRANFMKRVRARWRFDYHRKDTRLGLDNQDKEQYASTKRIAHQLKKETKKKQHVLNQKERRTAERKAMRENRRRAYIRQLPFYHPIKIIDKIKNNKNI